MSISPSETWPSRADFVAYMRERGATYAVIGDRLLVSGAIPQVLFEKRRKLLAQESAQLLKTVAPLSMLKALAQMELS